MKSLRAVAVVFALIVNAQLLTAQAVSGVVLDDATDAPIPAVSVMLIGADGSVVIGALTGDAGQFLMTAPRAGRYALRAERIGYHAVTTTDMGVLPRDTVEVVLRLSVEAVLLAPLTITSRAGPTRVDERLAAWGFYDRRAEYLTLSSGKAHFLDIDYIRKRTAIRVTDLLRDLHGVRVIPIGPTDAVVRGTGGCAFAVFLDGAPLRGSIDARVMVSDLAAVEVYATAPYPAQYAPTSSRQCGSVVIWTGWVRGKDA